MNFPVGVTFIWSGTHASIPSGWSRVTGLDGRYIKGTANATNPNQTGGSNTHTHTSVAHSHTITAHTHTVSLNSATAGGKDTGKTSSGVGGQTHGHVSTNSGAAASGALSSATSTYSSLSHEPQYYTVIFITPSTEQTYFPNNAIYLYDDTDNKTNHFQCNGLNSTPNFTSRFLKGAGTGANAGTTGGSFSHNSHTISHTHTETGHTHARVQSGTYTTTTDYETASGTATVVASHSHDIDLNSNTIGYGGTPVSTTQTANSPVYRELRPIQNRAGDDVRGGMIGLWLGTLDSIPSNYTLCDGSNGTQDMRSRYLRCASTVGGTGGSNTHTHSDSHSHTGSSHTHTATVEVQAVTNNTLNSGKKLPLAHGHTANVGSTSASWSTASTTGASSSNEPTYRTVAYIKLTAFKVDKSESVTAGESIKNNLIGLIGVEDSSTLSEHKDYSISDGNSRSISVWRDSISVTDTPDFPGPRDRFLQEGTTISENVTIKIINEVNEGSKPTINVEY